jgi:hypothetical protein
VSFNNLKFNQACEHACAANLGPNVYEVHVTISPKDLREIERFRVVSADLRLKTLIIDLADASQVQPMTCLIVRGSFERAKEQAVSCAEALKRHGFSVVRVKIEAAPTNLEIAGNAATLDPNVSYFECHIKVLINGKAEFSRLESFCDKNDLHISKNALRAFDNGCEERFVTMRSSSISYSRFCGRAEQHEKALREGGFTVLKVVSEACVFDSNRVIDNY